MVDIPYGEELTFEDGILLCKHIYQCAIHKTLQGVMEEWEIFQKTHEKLQNIEQLQKNGFVMPIEQKFDKRRLDELLFQFNMENIYATI